MSTPSDWAYAPATLDDPPPESGPGRSPWSYQSIKLGGDCFGNVTVGGSKKTVAAMSVIIGGVKKPVSAVSVIQGGVKKSLDCSGSFEPAALPLWGAAVEGNGDPALLETPSGRPLGVRRTYWNQNKTSSAVSLATSDVAAGRVPWLSFKLNDSWATINAGGSSADQWAIDLGNSLAQIPGTVMVTFHHEPEGDQPIGGFNAMHTRLYNHVKMHDNIRCGPILTAWTFMYGSPAYRLDSVFPGEFTAGDFLGIDGYNPYGEYPSLGTFNSETMEWTPQPGESPNLKMSRWAEMGPYYFDHFAPWAKSKGIDWAVGEFGFTPNAAQYEQNTYGEVRWLQEAWDSAVSYGGCLALSYFSSAYNSKCDWRIQTNSLMLAAWIAVSDQSVATSTTIPFLIPKTI